MDEQSIFYTIGLKSKSVADEPDFPAPRMDVDMPEPEDHPNEAVFIPRPFPKGPARPGCLPVRMFMLVTLICNAIRL